MLREFKVVKWWKGGKNRLKIHLIEQKSCNLLTQHQKDTQNVSKMRDDRKCKKAPFLYFNSFAAGTPLVE